MAEKTIHDSTRAKKTVPLGTVVIVQVFRQVRQCILDHSKEVTAACHRAPEAAHRFALRKIVRHHQHLTIRLEPVRRALNQVICRLPGTGKKHFYRLAPCVFRFSASGAAPIEENRHRRAAGVRILGWRIQRPNCQTEIRFTETPRHRAT